MAATRVLYIEDRPDNRSLVRRILMAEGIEVLEAGSADEGTTLARLERPDLILMDISMPGKDGFSATYDIRSIPELEHIPIVALTANVMKGDKERTLDAGCDGYIPKPIDVDRFPGEIIGFIRQGRLR
jgi:two-component system cell cycle response regulator DivK